MRDILLFITFLVVTSCSPQPKECSKFRTGTFKYLNSKRLNMIITRSDSTQVEFNKNTKVKMVGAVKWLSDCQYTLTYIEVSDSRASRLVGISFTVDITDTSKDSYKYRAYNDDKEITGEIIKIKNKLQ